MRTSYLRPGSPIAPHCRSQIAERDRIPYIVPNRSCRGQDPVVNEKKADCLKRIKILLIEDYRILRDGIKAVINAQADLTLTLWLRR